MTLPANVLMMPRHGGTPHDANVSPYFIASSMQATRISPAETANKTKKSWGDRLKLGGNKTKDDERRAIQQHELQLQQHQHQQQRELANKNYLLHEYRNKYGTLSGGSALSQSMKYAEPWLYNSVRQPNTTPPRPNILVYQQPIAPIPSEVPRHNNFQQTLIPHITMCSCPEFIGGTMRSKKHTTPTGICKKCGGSRMPWRGGGTLRATSVRLNPETRFGGTVRVGQTHVRPSLMNVSPNYKSFAPDPYDLMRRNRLGGGGGGAEEEAVVGDAKRGRRAKSSSPGRHRQGRSRSPPMLKQQEEPRRARRDVSWENVGEDEDNGKRKSILECDVNPYQLISKYLKNGEPVGRNEGFISDNDDELSDDMSDNVLEEVKPVSIDVKTRKTEEKSSQKGVSIGGQRIHVFSSAAANDGEYVNDEDIPAKSPAQVSMIPRLSTPKRPQRRVKSLDGVTGKRVVVVEVRDDENESSTRGETSSTNSQIERRSNLVSTHIKSILKKPSAPPAALETAGSVSGGSSCSSGGSGTSAKTFGDTIREPDERSSAASQSPAEPQLATSTNSVSNFYLPTFQEFKRENRKKKQVQFNVVQRECKDVQPVEEDGVVVDAAAEDISDKVICDRRGKVDDNVIEVTFKVSEPKLRYFGDQIEDVLVHAPQPDQDNSGRAAGMPPTVGLVWRDRHLSADMDEATTTRVLPHSTVTLRRSLSDRQVLTSDDNISQAKQEQTAALFNDTMRLRLLSGRRTDSRHAFSHPGASSDVDDVATRRRVLSPGRSRPKEPPPPPPLPTTVHIHPEPQAETAKKTQSPEIESEIIIPELEETKSAPTLLKFSIKSQTPPKDHSEVQISTPNEIEKDTENVQKLPEVQDGVPAPPQLPPRHIFPFTKKQIQNINHNKRHSSITTSPSSTLVRANARKARPNSCIPYIPAQATDAGASHASRIRHRNSDPGPGMTKVSLPPTETTDVNDGVRTVVSVCPDSPDVHRLQIKTDVTKSRRTSILINGDTHEINPHLTTSFSIDDNIDNNNKVTISVGGTDSGPWNANSCVIETTYGSNTNSLTRVNHTTNQITIPVSPEPVYNQRSNILVDDQHVVIVDRTTGKSLGTQHDYEVLEMLLDPVEAVRHHLVPHVCGKVNPDGGANLVSSSAMDRLNSLFAEQQQQLNGYSASDTTGSVVEISSPESSLSDTHRYSASSAIGSEKHGSEVETTSDQENNGISIHYFAAPCLPRFVLGDGHNDEDKLDDGQSHKEDIYDDAENIYESIKDPIYEEIGLPDTPPPLPLSPPPSLDDLDDKRTSRSIFEGASKYDILNYLVDAKERGYVESDYNSSNGDDIVEVIDGKPVELTVLGTLSSRVSNLSSVSDSSDDSTLIITSALDAKDGVCRKSSADVERNDSGVGSETSKSSRSRWQTIPTGAIREDQIHLCEDCDQHVDTQVTDSGVMYAPLVCRKCGKKRAERKDTIAEIVETEEKYGGDLRIILEEFYRPMLVAGLLTSEQLSAIFLNVEELLENNAVLAEKLRDAHDIALEQGDEDLLTVNIGRLFLEAAPMLHAFESYCTRQGGASLLLANLEKEKELLRIFLRVSQMENAVLRRMNLNSFLMVPVQRVTKYPLLLARLHKVTPAHHEGRDLLKQAQHKIELHLEHMNSVAKDISTTKLWRRISIVNGRRLSSEIDMINIKLRKMSVDVLEWNHDEVKFAMEGRMLYTNPTDNNWRKGRTIKLNPINALLVTNGKPTEDYRPEDELLLFPRKTGVREATLLLVKEKCGRYSLLRDPLYLDKCIVCCETDWEDYFEVQELASKDTFIFKAEDSERTKLWYRQLQYHSQGLGAWRRRRNALANIMINGMSRN